MIPRELPAEQAWLREQIDTRGIYRAPPGSRELLHMDGRGAYRWQFYLRAALLQARALRLVARHFWELNAGRYAAGRFQIAGVESAAVPILSAIIMEADQFGVSDLNAFTIRKERKTYGRGNIIEGLPSGDPVLLVDDLTSPQHNAFWHAVRVIGEARLPLCDVAYVVVCKMETSDVRIATSLGAVAVQSMFTLNDFHLEP